MCALNLHQDVQRDGFVKKFQTALEYSLLTASKAFKKNSHNYEYVMFALAIILAASLFALSC